MKPHIWKEFEYRSRNTLDGLLIRMRSMAEVNGVDEAHISITIEGAGPDAHVSLNGTLTLPVDDKPSAVSENDYLMWPAPTGPPNTDHPPPFSDEQQRDVTALRPRP